jgi:hypothetical protein
MPTPNIQKDKYRCINGPMAGVDLLLSSGRTLPFKYKGQCGYYSATSGKTLIWVQVK